MYYNFLHGDPGWGWVPLMLNNVYDIPLDSFICCLASNHRRCPGVDQPLRGDRARCADRPERPGPAAAAAVRADGGIAAPLFGAAGVANFFWLTHKKFIKRTNVNEMMKQSFVMSKKFIRMVRVWLGMTDWHTWWKHCFSYNKNNRGRGELLLI